ncbi:sulfatase-like hydrolase/transferase [Verrucomicrobiaceae bacterium N1E253]|uniref:Sulfatase-like hydrolase/transferase n=1 Tax=Oceaniferula marina TaxID=2748318 RepID=A0A851GGM4_9BACT|nr:sulfatase-like hydrolase/transferase [Oceaniferula marina]NWK54991.1 sulfatase-like hydrolase/transferase [Oceaniferula marina]
MRSLFSLIALYFFTLTVSHAAPPNIILIISDDAGYVDYGFMGSKEMITPNIDKLASSGTIFSQAYVQSTCSPSRASLMTGLIQQRLGFDRNNGNSTTVKNDGLEPDNVLIFERLKKLGYTTGVIGKWHVGAVKGYNRPEDQGVDDFYGFLGGGRQYFGIAKAENQRVMRNQKDISALWQNEGNAKDNDPKKGRYLTDALGDEAAAFIDRHHKETKPFFLYVAFNSPHTPLQAKSQDLARFPKLEGKRKIVAAMNLAMDRSVGKIVNQLDKHQIRKNTLIVFINDNGGQIAYGNYNGELRGGKGSTYEGGIRTPMIFAGPHIKEGAHYPHPVSSLDFMSTFVNLAGGKVHFPTDGVNLLPYLNGKISERPHQTLFFRHIGNQSLRHGDWKIQTVNAPSGYETHKAKGDKPQKVSYELYNLTDDPYEKNDLASKHPKKVKELLRLFVDYETSFPKPRWGRFGKQDRNLANTFTYQGHDQNKSISKWNDLKGWKELNSSVKSPHMSNQDGCLNTVLKFPVNSGNSYTAENNLTSMSGHAFIVNSLRFEGDQGKITLAGNPVTLVANEQGGLPSISVSGTASQAFIDLPLIPRVATNVTVASGSSLHITKPLLAPLNTAAGKLTLNGQLILSQSMVFSEATIQGKSLTSGVYSAKQLAERFPEQISPKGGSITIQKNK